MRRRLVCHRVPPLASGRVGWACFPQQPSQLLISRGLVREKCGGLYPQSRSPTDKSRVWTPTGIREARKERQGRRLRGASQRQRMVRTGRSECKVLHSIQPSHGLNSTPYPLNLRQVALRDIENRRICTSGYGVNQALLWGKLEPLRHLTHWLNRRIARRLSQIHFDFERASSVNARSESSDS
jgi:hypothetical protein